MQAAALVYKATCAQVSGQKDLGSLTQELLGQVQTGELERVLADTQLFAVVCGADGQRTVIAKTSLRLCKARDCAGCSNLHLCKFYLLGEDCPHNRGRRVCRFSHDLYSDHNSQLLQQHNLQELQREGLCTLLLQNDGSLPPQVCFTYNKGTGEFGFCPDKDGCRRLHMCEKYLRGTCHTGDCDRSHDFFEPHPMRVLQARGLSSGMVASLLPVFRNILALWDSNSLGPHCRFGTREPEICLFHIKSFCKQGNRCGKVHFHLPYRWEFKDEHGWSLLTDNEAIERDYCDPSKTYSGGNVPVHFDTMTRNSAEVRRISTVSSVTHPNFLLTTRWAWHWEDEFGHWTQYASPEGAHQSASITSEELEKKYLEDNNATVEFNAGKHTYELSMQDMIQSNKRFGTKRLVRRRPIFVSAADVQRIKISSVQTSRGMPRHWDKQDMPETGFKRVKLASSSQEYTAIVELFTQTMSGCRVISVERVQNRALWDVFQWQADQMRKNNSGNTNERILFHGTDSKHIDAICQQNFDWRICGTHGTAYGKGSYFARDAKYSHKYTSASGARCMFACRVLLGEYTRGSSSYVRPPPKEDSTSVFYDSCVNSMSDPSVFVVFEKHQVYPEYLIQYREDAQPPAAVPVSDNMPPQGAYVAVDMPDTNLPTVPAYMACSAAGVSSLGADASKSFKPPLRPRPHPDSIPTPPFHGHTPSLTPPTPRPRPSLAPTPPTPPPYRPHTLPDPALSPTLPTPKPHPFLTPPTPQPHPSLTPPTPQHRPTLTPPTPGHTIRWLRPHHSLAPPTPQPCPHPNSTPTSPPPRPVPGHSPVSTASTSDANLTHSVPFKAIHSKTSTTALPNDASVGSASSSDPKEVLQSRAGFQGGRVLGPAGGTLSSHSFSYLQPLATNQNIQSYLPSPTPVSRQDRGPLSVNDGSQLPPPVPRRTLSSTLPPAGSSSTIQLASPQKDLTHLIHYFNDLSNQK